MYLIESALEQLVAQRLAEARAEAARQAVVRAHRRPVRECVGVTLIRAGAWLLGGRVPVPIARPAPAP